MSLRQRSLESIAAENQNVFCSVTGGYTGHHVDKVAALKELGIQFYKAKKIKALMIKEAAMNAECKVIKIERLGDHIMFVGEVVGISADVKIRPIVYHDGRYWKIGGSIMKPSEAELEKMRQIVAKHRKKTS